jgi:hypothetical protein
MTIPPESRSATITEMAIATVSPVPKFLEGGGGMMLGRSFSHFARIQ